MSDFANITVVSTLSRFFDVVEHTESFTTPDTQRVLERLIFLFNLNYSMSPVYLPQFMAYICTLWASDNLTVEQLGYLEWATLELNK